MKKITVGDLKILQDLSKKYNIIWFMPTQTDVITVLGRYIGKLFFAQRRFSPRSQWALVNYHDALDTAKVMSDAGKKRKGLNYDK